MTARAIALLAVLCGCPQQAPARPKAPRATRAPRATPTAPTAPTAATATQPPAAPPAPGAAAISWRRVETAAAMPPAPAPGTYQVHLIDVGTGLAILIRGADFAMLYDAGTNDPDEHPLRVAAYLAASLGPSGDDLCVPRGEPAPAGRRRLDHVVLSHPHRDHASALDLVLHCYDVADFWDAGRVSHTSFYRELIAQVARSPGITYHTAASVPDDRALTVKGYTARIPRWERFSDGDAVALGAGARFTILHADPKAQPDANANSVVLLVELGATRLLLTGDAESGERRDPAAPPGETEAYLLDHHAAALRADILQVAHHGSKTSSRRAFLGAVRPRLALVSSGPKQYGRVTLPDPEVIGALAAEGAALLRTDERDASCPVSGRIGGDRGPGGCDSWVILIDDRARPRRAAGAADVLDRRSP